MPRHRRRSFGLELVSPVEDQDLLAAFEQGACQARPAGPEPTTAIIACSPTWADLLAAVTMVAFGSRLSSLTFRLGTSCTAR